MSQIEQRHFQHWRICYKYLIVRWQTGGVQARNTISSHLKPTGVVRAVCQQRDPCCRSQASLMFINSKIQKIQHNMGAVSSKRWVLLFNPTVMASALCPHLLWSEQKFSSRPLGSPNCCWETETNASNPSAVTSWIFHFSPTIMLLLWRFPLPFQRNNGNSTFRKLWNLNL